MATGQLNFAGVLRYLLPGLVGVSYVTYYQGWWVGDGAVEFCRCLTLPTTRVGVCLTLPTTRVGVAVSRLH